MKHYKLSYPEENKIVKADKVEDHFGRRPYEEVNYDMINIDVDLNDTTHFQQVQVWSNNPDLADTILTAVNNHSPLIDLAIRYKETCEIRISVIDAQLSNALADNYEEDNIDYLRKDARDQREHFESIIKQIDEVLDAK